MSTIAIGYNKITLKNRMNVVRSSLSIGEDMVLGLAFGKRNITSTGGGFEPPKSHLDPLVFLVYDKGNTFEYVHLNGESTGFEFSDLTYYTNYMGEIMGEPIEGDYYKPLSDSGYEIIESDDLEHADHETFDNFGFAFFHYDHLQYFFAECPGHNSTECPGHSSTECPEQDLLLSGAKVYFGIGGLFNHPKECVSLKLEIFGIPEKNTCNGYNEIYVDQPPFSCLYMKLQTKIEEIQNYPELKNKLTDIRNRVLSDRLLIQNIKVAVIAPLPDPSAQSYFDKAKSIRNHITSLLSSNIIEYLTENILEVVSGLNTIDVLQRPMFIQAAKLSCNIISKIIQVNMAASKVAEIALTRCLRENNMLGNSLDTYGLSSQLSVFNINFSNMTTQVVAPITAAIAEAEASQTEPIQSDPQTTQMGQPAVIVGPPCPPYWVPD